MSNRKPFTLGENPTNEVAFNAYGLITPETERVRNIPLSLLDSHENNRYSVKYDQKMQELASSIAEYGVMEPLLVTPNGDRFTILAGHRRKAAAELAGLIEVPCLVKEVGEEDQDNIIIDTNNQREQTISEKAWGYRTKYDAERRKQGHRSDLSGEEGGSTLDKLSCGSEDSRSQIARLIKITNLIPELLLKVDEGLIPLHAAEKISSISREGQETISECLSENENKKITIEQAEFLQDADREGSLSYAFVQSLLFSSKKKEIAGDPDEIKRQKEIDKFNKVTKDCFPEEAAKYVDFTERKALITKLIKEWLNKIMEGGETIES